MQALKLLTLLVFASFTLSCANHKPQGVIPVHDSIAVQKALSQFNQNPALIPFFDDAVAIAIIPKNVRAGTGFGGAFGRGWLIKDGQIIKRIIHWQFLAGADIGAQIYGQILFFKTQEAIEAFYDQPFQFAAQGNATAGLWGLSWNPSYNSEVAIFTHIDGGLMIEGSVGMHSYHALKP